MGPVPSSVTAQTVELDPIGDVMGAIATQIGRRGSGPFDPHTGRTRYGTTTSGDGSGSRGYRPYARSVDRTHTEALRRLLAEATLRHADGVIGIVHEVAEDDDGLLEVVVRGTAVRAGIRQRPGHVFTTDLDGPQVSALMGHGWAPVAAVWGFSIGVRPTDWAAAQQRQWTAGTQEVTGYGDLVARTRADARDQLAARARRAGADGVLAPSMTVRERSELVCEAFVRGTAIVRVEPVKAQGCGARSVLPLDDP
jgi:uncharacterized protein YbjQ (UPF0145 family)